MKVSEYLGKVRTTYAMRSGPVFTLVPHPVSWTREEDIDNRRSSILSLLCDRISSAHAAVNTVGRSLDVRVTCGSVPIRFSMQFVVAKKRRSVDGSHSFSPGERFL